MIILILIKAINIVAIITINDIVVIKMNVIANIDLYNISIFIADWEQ